MFWATARVRHYRVAKTRLCKKVIGKRKNKILIRQKIQDFTRVFSNIRSQFRFIS